MDSLGQAEVNLTTRLQPEKSTGHKQRIRRFVPVWTDSDDYGLLLQLVDFELPRFQEFGGGPIFE